METQLNNFGQGTTSVNQKSNKLRKAGIIAGGALLLGGVGATLLAATPSKKSSKPESDEEEHDNAETEVQETVENGENKENVENFEEEVSEEQIEEVPVKYDASELVKGDVEIAGSVNDDMAFDEAFNAAREEVGTGGAFVWEGNVYGTYTADEWNAMSPEQHDEYYNNFDWNNIDAKTDEEIEELEQEIVATESESEVEEPEMEEVIAEEELVEEVIVEEEPTENINFFGEDEIKDMIINDDDEITELEEIIEEEPAEEEVVVDDVTEEELGEEVIVEEEPTEGPNFFDENEIEEMILNDDDEIIGLEEIDPIVE